MQQLYMAFTNSGYRYLARWAEISVKRYPEFTKLSSGMTASRAITDAELAALVDSLRAYLREMADIPVDESKRLQAEIETIMAAKPPDAAERLSSAGPTQATRASEAMSTAAAAVLQPLHADDKAVISKLGYEREVQQLREGILAWVADASEEMRLATGLAVPRPLEVLPAAHGLRLLAGRRAPDGIAPDVLLGAIGIELLHNVSLIVDDILDASDERRGVPTLHRQFGSLPALMASGYVVADAFRLLADDPIGIRLLSELLRRLGVAECLQWRLRRQPLGVEDWRVLAGEDTGTMFEVCACMGTRNEDLRKFGRLLGMLYHGCDDVGDARGLEALGGGGDEDVRDGILTLPAAFAIRDSRIRTLFCKENPAREELDETARAIRARVPDAEAYLDGIADEARAEAFSRAPNPEPLFALIDHTRQLSRR